MRATVLTVVALTSSAVIRADVIQSTVVLPPASGAYVLAGLCVDALDRCTQNAMVSGFAVVTRTVDAGDELVIANAIYSADIFTESGGLPDMFIGRLTIPGTVHFTYFGRDPSVNPLGTFTTEVTDFTFQGLFNGNTFEVVGNPGEISMGLTTILPVSAVPPITYVVSGSLEIFALFSVNGSPFMPAPPRTARLDEAPAPIPEPQLGLLAGAILVGFIGIRSRRRRVL
jgi:hypothetical protein